MSATDGDGSTTHIQRDSNNLPTQITAPYGQVTQLVVNSDEVLESVKNLAGEMHSMQYYSGGLLREFKKPNGASSIFEYDNLGNLTKDTDASGAFISLHQFIGTIGSAIRITTSKGTIKDYTHDIAEESEVLRFTDENWGLATSYTFGTANEVRPSNGDVITTKRLSDPRLGMPTIMASSKTMRLGDTGPVMTQINSRAYEPSITNNFFAFKTTDTSVINGKTYSSSYDGANRTIASYSPLSRWDFQKLDLQGRPVKSQRSGLSEVNYSYDPRGRLSQINQSQRSTSITYDNVGNVASVTDPLGQLTSYQYDLVGRVTQVQLPDGRQIGKTYDVNGNVTSITPAGRPAHTFSFNILDLVNDYFTPQANRTNYLYNSDKQIERITRPDGQLIRYNYDQTTSRLLSITTSQGTYTYTYDSRGQVESITSPHGVITNYTYQGSMLAQAANSGATAGTIEFSYNNDLVPSSIAVNGSSVNLVYDNDGLLIKNGDLMLGRNSSGLISTVEFGMYKNILGYNEYGEMISNDTNGAVFYYERDKLGRWSGSDGTFLGSPAYAKFTFDNSGRIVNVVNGGGPLSNYTYDINSNRTTIARRGFPTLTATYDSEDRILTLGSTTFVHNANGERISKTIGGQTTSYLYDSFGNMTGVKLPNGDQIKYLLDGQNRRVGRVKNNVLLEQYVYDSQTRISAVLDGAGSIKQRLLYGKHSHSPDVILTPSGNYRLLTDNVGTIVVVGADSGVLKQVMAFNESGFLYEDSNPGFQPFGFAGGLMDPDTKLIHFGARDYDPETSRWMTKDPIGFAGGDTNLYGYVMNDPLNLIDPDGLRTTVLIYKNNMGHVAVEAGTGVAAPKGFYPSSLAGALYTNGVVKNDIGRDDIKQIIDLDTTPQQEQMIRDYYATHGAIDKYGLFTNNCSIFASKALNAAGVKAPSAILPSNFGNQLGGQ